MNNSGKYAFGFLAFVFLIAGVIVLMEEITGKGDPQYFLPCGLIGIGLMIGLLGLGLSSLPDNSMACTVNQDPDKSHYANESNEAATSVDAGAVND